MEKIERNEKKCILEKLEKECKEHNFYYQYEGSYSIWKDDSDTHKFIRGLIARAKELDFEEEAREIYNKYTPKKKKQ